MENNYIIHGLNIALKNEIKYLTRAFIIQKRSTIFQKEKYVLIAITRTSLLLISISLSTVISNQNLDTVTSIIFPKKEDKLIILFSNKKLTLNINDRSNFYKALSCNYSLYYMEKYYQVKELCILEKRKRKANKEIGTGEFVLYHNKNGYSYYISHHHIFEKGYHKIKEISLFINVSKLFEISKDGNDEIGKCFRGEIRELLEKKYERWIMIKEEHPYNKKMNINNDNAMWECRRIEYITSTNYKITIIFLRREFIPPFYLHFQDIMITMVEPITSVSNSKVIETVADTMYCTNREESCHHFQYDQILTANSEGLLLDEKTYDFYYYVLNLRGKKAYIFGLKYLYKLIYLCDPHSSLIGIVWNLLFEEEIECQKEGYGIVLAKYSIDTIIREFIENINIYNSGDYFLKYKLRWEEKIWRYLGFVVNGGINKDFTFEEVLLGYNTNKDNMGKIGEQIEKMLYFNDKIINWNLFKFLLKKKKITLFIKNANALHKILEEKLSEENIDISFVTNLKIFISHYQMKNRINFAPLVTPILKGLTNKFSSQNLILELLKLVNEMLFPETVKELLKDSQFITILEKCILSSNEKIIFISIKILNALLYFINASKNTIDLDEIIPNLDSIISILLDIITNYSANKNKFVSIYHYDYLTTKSCFIILINMLKIKHQYIYEKIKKIILENQENLAGHFKEAILYYLNESETETRKKADIFSMQITILKFLNILLRKNYSDSRSFLEINYGSLINSICFQNLDFAKSIENESFSIIEEENDLNIRKLELVIKFSLIIMKQNPQLITQLKEYENFPYETILITLQNFRKKYQDTPNKNDNNGSTTQSSQTNNNNSFTCSNNNDGNLSISFNKMEDISKSDFSFNDISVIKEEDHESSPRTFQNYFCKEKVKKLKIKRKFRKKSDAK